MINVNSFRFGQISRKQAGRFLEEGYNNGTFTFSNARTYYDGGMSRRFPLRTDVSLPQDARWFRIHPMFVSQSEVYLFAFGTRNTSTSWENLVRIYRYTENSFELFSEITSSNDNGKRTFCIGENDLSEIQLTQKIAGSMCISQHRNRLYIASHSFRTMFFEMGAVPVASIATFLFNQDSKGKIYYIPSSNESEGLVLFESNGKLYKDISMTVPYEGDYSLAKPAVNSYVAYFDDYNDEKDLNTRLGTYPAVVSFIGERMWLANTEINPNAIWCSMLLGESQWIAGYGSDSMHDFTEFKVIATEKLELKDSSEWPVKTDSKYFHTSNGLDRWFIPKSDPSDTDYSDGTELFREAKYWKYTSNSMLFYYESGGKLVQYTWTTSDGKPKLNEDKTWTGGGKTLQAYNASEVYPLSIADSEGNLNYWHASDWVWKKSDGTVYDISNGLPVKWPITEYDTSDPDALYETKTDVMFVADDSCAVCNMEMNSGRDSEIEFISSALGNIIIGTSSSVHTISGSFVPSESSVEEYSSGGSLFVQPAKLGSSFLYIERGNIVREIYKSSSYTMSADATAYNHDLMNAKAVSMCTKQSPDKMIFITMDDGTICAIHYSRDDSMSSQSIWSTEGIRYISTAVLSTDTEDKVMVLCDDGTSQHICHFDEESEVYEDIIGTTTYPYDTLVETVYAEINNNNIVFGKFKKAKSIYIRPYRCGHVYVGNDLRMLQKSNYRLESNDFSAPAFGKSQTNFSMFIKSCGNEPMNILAISWENE